MPTFPDYPITDDYAAHVRRGSAEPGIDFATPYDTPVAATVSGVVLTAYSGTSGGAGRRVVIAGQFNMWDIIHLSRVDVRVGQWVNEGQIIGHSGASGFGRDWYYGPHVHISYFPGHYKTLPAWHTAQDFAHLLHAAPADVALEVTPEPEPEIERTLAMLKPFYIQQSNGTQAQKDRIWEVFTDPRTGEWVKRHIGPAMWQAVQESYSVNGEKVPKVSSQNSKFLNTIPTWRK